jgi:hypothetical protein
MGAMRLHLPPLPSLLAVTSSTASEAMKTASVAPAQNWRLMNHEDAELYSVARASDPRKCVSKRVYTPASVLRGKFLERRTQLNGGCLSYLSPGPLNTATPKRGLELSDRNMRISPIEWARMVPTVATIPLAIERKGKTPLTIRFEGATCLPKSNIQRIVEDLRSAAKKCAKASRDCADEELTDYLQEIRVILKAFASTLEEFDQ